MERAKMNAPHRTHRHQRNRLGFTLIEILVVVVIIGILVAFAVPAIQNAIRTAKTGAMRMEVGAIADAIEQYEQMHGDYPPDFSSWAVVERHYQKLFPRMSNNDKQLLRNALHPSGVFDATAMDRAEALVWTLGGYSDNPQRPFTGPGGPLAWAGDGMNRYTDPGVTDADRRNGSNFQINSDRINRLYDFDPARLNYSKVDPSQPIAGPNRLLSTDDGDLFPTYAATNGGAPIVYFDSRTYDFWDPVVGDFNGFYAGPNNVIRPYLSDQLVGNNSGGNYANAAQALKAWRFVNSDTFQVIAPGLDNVFGSVASFDVDGDGSVDPIYFQYPTGRAIAPRGGVGTPGALLVPGASRFQESSAFGTVDNFQLDNVTNFSRAKIVDDVEI